MKHLIILGLLLFGAFTSFSKDLLLEKYKTENVVIKPLKKIDITIRMSGYTIRIRGDVSFSLLTGNVNIKGTITIITSGYEVDYPVDYSGPLKKGPNKPIYTVMEISNEEFEVVDMIMTRLYLDKDPKNIYFK